MNLDQFRRACLGVDQETRATELKPGPVIWLILVWKGVCLCEWGSGASWEKGHYQGLCSLIASAEVQAHSHVTPKPQLPKTISFLYKAQFSLLTGLHRERNSLFIQSKQLCLIPNHNQELTDLAATEDLKIFMSNHSDCFPTRLMQTM